MPFVKPEKKKDGVKFLVYGESGSGKTPFALSFPKQANIDADSGTTFYDKSNIVIQSDVLSLKDLNSDLDDIEMDEDIFNEIQSFVADSVTRFHENQQHAGLNVAESRARQNGRSAEAEGLSFREYGKMRLKYDSFYQRMMGYAKQAKNLVFVAEQKDKNENKGGQVVKVGVMPNMQKDSEFDFDVVIRTYNKDGESYGKILKDRTGTFKVGEEVERPHYNHWKEAIEKAQQGKKRDKSEIKNFDDVLQEEAEDIDEDVKVESLKNNISQILKGLDREQKNKFIELLNDDKELGTHKYKNFKDVKKLEKTLEHIKSV